MHYEHVRCGCGAILKAPNLKIRAMRCDECNARERERAVERVGSPVSSGLDERKETAKANGKIGVCVAAQRIEAGDMVAVDGRFFVTAARRFSDELAAVAIAARFKPAKDDAMRPEHLFVAPKPNPEGESAADYYSRMAADRARAIGKEREQWARDSIMPNDETSRLAGTLLGKEVTFRFEVGNQNRVHPPFFQLNVHAGVRHATSRVDAEDYATSGELLDAIQDEWRSLIRSLVGERGRLSEKMAKRVEQVKALEGAPTFSLRSLCPSAEVIRTFRGHGATINGHKDCFAPGEQVREAVMQLERGEWHAVCRIDRLTPALVVDAIWREMREGIDAEAPRTTHVMGWEVEVRIR